MTFEGAARWLPRLAVCLALAFCPAAGAQVARGRDAIHWAYSAFFGAGRYTLTQSQDVYTFGLKPRKQLREPQVAEDGDVRAGLELRLPVALSVYDFGDTSATSGLRVSALSIVPGMEFELPISDRWSLKPLVYLGWGTDLDDDSSAVIYWAGLKSRLRFPTRNGEWALVNSLMQVGYEARSGPSDRMLPLMTGFEFDTQLGKRTIGGEPVHLIWHASHTAYLEALELDVFDSDRAGYALDTEWEIGVAFRKRDSRLKLGRLSWDRVGVAYRFADGGDFSAIKLVFHSLFDR